MSFRINAKQLFITWPQCPIPKQTILDFILTLGAILGAVIVQETHENGAFHIHALIEFDRKKNIKRPDYFDIVYEDQTYHPNIQAVRNVLKAKNYLAKEDTQPLLYGNTDAFTASKYRDYAEELRQLSPSKRINYSIQNKIQKWQYDAILSKREDLTIYQDPAVGQITDPFIQDAEYVADKVLILQGHTGCGKTTKAKSLGPYPMLWVSHLDDLKHFVSGFHMSIIFDDMCFTHLPRQTQLHLVDTFDVRSIHIRYGVVTIPNGVSKIFTCNFDNFPFLETDEAINRRVHLVFGVRE